MTGRVSFGFDSRPVVIETEATTAVDLLRTDLAATGTKLVCGAGTCGACVIQVDGVPVASCLLGVEELEGRSVTTIKGLFTGEPHPIQRAFAAHDWLQCGFCTPGFVMAVAAFHDRWRGVKWSTRPAREEIVRALAGHLCRCGAYAGILSAIEDACAGLFDQGPISGPSRRGGQAHASCQVHRWTSRSPGCSTVGSYGQPSHMQRSSMWTPSAAVDTLAEAAGVAGRGSRRAPQAAYKLGLLEGVVRRVFEEAVVGSPLSDAVFGERPL